jgi:hypothetical protein
MKIILLSVAIMAASFTSFAQVGIGTTNPDVSAALHLKTGTTNQGLLIPRMSTASRDANILSPIAGILIFNTTASEFQVSTSANAWVNLGTYATTAAATGTTASIGMVGIGTNSPNPNTVLDVVSTTKGVLLPLLTADPVAVAGMIYYHVTNNKVRGCSDGTNWTDLN